MGNLTLNGSTSGAITVSPAAVAGTNTITLPAATGTVALTASPTFSGTVTATTITSPSATALTIQSAGTDAMTIDATQHVGIGCSPLTNFDVLGTVLVRAASATGTALTLSADTTNANGVSISSTFLTGGFGPLKFLTSNTEQMRLDNSGNLLVGTTSAAGTADALLFLKKSGGTTWQAGPSGVGSGNLFYVINSSDVGVYLSSGSTSWAANSDERLKTDLVPITDGAEKVSSLRAVTGRFKTDKEGTSRSFLIAQDVQKVLPEAVDASNPDKLGVQYTDVIPLLVAAIQELEARLAALEAK